jgi:hypothetical protein
MKIEKRPNLGLTNAAKRNRITLRSVRVPTIRYNGFEISCSSVEEAAELVAKLESQESKKIKRGVQVQGLDPVFSRLFGGVETSPWTREAFWAFIEQVGETQRRILALLVEKRKVTDQEMRKALKLESNQQLAGFLSGISKQAGAHNIPARSVFTIENESESGEVKKTYVVAWDFLRMATDQNWPAE